MPYKYATVLTNLCKCYKIKYIIKLLAFAES